MMTRWNRCTTVCGCDRNPSKYASCKCQGGCERGRDDNKQRIVYALNVLSELRGDHSLICPLTGLPFKWEDSEIDRLGGKGTLYEPGNIILVSRLGNSLRGILQSDGTDILGANRYMADVKRASQSVKVTRKCHLPRLTPRSDGRSIIATRSDLNLIVSGPYGIA